MDKIILLFSAKIGTFVNFLNCYPNHLKNKFNYNQKKQFLLIISIILYLCGFYIYLGSKSQYLSALYYFFSLLFFIQFIMLLGMLIHKGNSELYFPLKQFYSEYKNGGFIISSQPSNFLNNKEKNENQYYTKRKIKSIKRKNQLELNIENLESFLIRISNHEYFDKEKFQFDYSKFEFETNRYPNQSWAYYTLLIFFFEELLNDKTYLTKLNSKYFEPFNNKILINKDRLKSVNWSTFRKNYVKNDKLDSLKKSKFYISLLETYNKSHSNSNSSNN
jgi:hypothetical protein